MAPLITHRSALPLAIGRCSQLIVNQQQQCEYKQVSHLCVSVVGMKGVFLSSMVVMSFLMLLLYSSIYSFTSSMGILFIASVGV